MHSGRVVARNSGRRSRRAAVVTALLIGVSEAQQRQLSKGLANQLHSDRYATGRKSGGYRDGREPGDGSEKTVPCDLRLPDRHYENLLVRIHDRVEPLIGKYREYLFLQRLSAGPDPLQIFGIVLGMIIGLSLTQTFFEGLVEPARGDPVIEGMNRRGPGSEVAKPLVDLGFRLPLLDI